VSHVARLRTSLPLGLYPADDAVTIPSLIVNPHDSVHKDRQEVALGFALAGLATLGASLVPAATALRHLYDAVNIYNDGVAKQPKP
jgi:hypothetical protein